jgi:hypothetical protein
MADKDDLLDVLLNTLLNQGKYFLAIGIKLQKLKIYK